MLSYTILYNLSSFVSNFFLSSVDQFNVIGDHVNFDMLVNVRMVYQMKCALAGSGRTEHPRQLRPRMQGGRFWAVP